MKLGTFSPEISAGSTEELFQKAKDYGFSQMQFDYESAGIEEMPEFVPDSLNQEIANEAVRNEIEIVAVNGTFNMAHPDLAVRKDGIERFEKIAASCSTFACELVTLCTGSRNRQNMWVPHADNNTPEAWKDMVTVMEQLILTADEYNIYLGIETEASNVINTAQKARRLIDELKSPRLKIILDAANLFQPGMAKRGKVQGVIAEAFELLGPWITLAHGKDIKEGEGIAFANAGKGIIDFHFFLEELEEIGYKGGMILHGIKQEKDIPECVDYMKKIAGNFNTFRN